MASLYYVTGTDTEVGKTYCTAKTVERMMECGQRVGVYKPVASGCEVRPDGERYSVDATTLWQAAGRPKNIDAVCPQRFIAALSPPRSAAKEGTQVDTRRLRDGLAVWCDGEFDVVMIEGAGGLFSPISDDWLNIDLAIEMKRWSEQNGHSFELLLVAPDRLGVLHHVISTSRAAAAAGMPIIGLILNRIDDFPDDSTQTNAEDLLHWCAIPMIASVQHPGGPLVVFSGANRDNPTPETSRETAGCVNFFNQTTFRR
ncbi:dethiobiotin synthase [Rhodopirellula bahusiensis]|uniref:dethiobiotin synthase n=2 Tax=Rhodopirellula bahusiensis TaxID=2014065 RepID=UPI00326460A3